MKLNFALKKFAVDTLGVKADASDEDFLKAISDALLKGKVTAAKLTELEATPDAKAKIEGVVTEVVGSQFKSFREELLGEIKGMFAQSQSQANTSATKTAADDSDSTDDDDGTKAAYAEFTKSISGGARVLGGDGASADDERISPTKALASHAAAKQQTTVETLPAIRHYNANNKTAAFHPDNSKHFGLRGQPVLLQGRPIDRPSDAEKAAVGAFIKWQWNLQSPNDVPRNMRFTDHDKELLHWGMKNLAWNGDIEDRTVNQKKLTDMQIKALINDGTSGGTNAVPVPFDDMVILTPLLYGELFPFVNLVNVSKGDQIDGATFANPTIANKAEGTAIDLFTTTSFIGAFDTGFFEATGAMEIGADFEEDSAVGITQIVTEAYGNAFLQWLDSQIALGDGTTEPLGIFETVSPNTASTTSGTSGDSLDVADLEAMMFGVTKAFRKGGRNVFVMNETNYRRFMATPVGTSDQRRVLGMNYEDYMLIGFPAKICDDIANTKAAFVNLARYRMYRRLGATFRIETSGKTLALTNTKLIVFRARFGGKMEDANAVCLMEDLPA